MIKLKEFREEKGLTQKELAIKLSVDAHNVGDWERGKCEPSAAMLYKLSNALEVSIYELIGVEDYYHTYSQSTDQTLSKDEKTMLDAFRTLGPFEREAILIQIKALAGEKSLIKK